MITPLFDQEGGSPCSWARRSISASRRRPLSKRQARAAQGRELPPRQREVLERMAQGLLNKQIAWELKISEKTVKMHRALLLERLGVSTTAEAIRIAVEAGL